MGRSDCQRNRLLNRMPSKSIEGEIPTLRWDPTTIIDFTTLLPFGQHGSGSIYQSNSAAERKLLPRYECANFVGMESDTRLIRIYVPADNKVKLILRVDFKPVDKEKLPNISSSFNGIYHQHSLESDSNVDGDAEENLLRCMITPIIHFELSFQEETL